MVNISHCEALRPTVQLRTEFGHWELDSVLGRKNENEPVVMTLVKRMTRNALWIKARNHTAEAINEALADILKLFGKQCSAVFKSITDYSADDIQFFADRINGLPRKILGYHTPEELFEKQLDRIYAA